MVIELTERPYWVSPQYDLVLDLLPTSELRLTEAVQNLTKGSLNLSYSLPINIAATPKNKILLGDTKKNYLKCRVTLAGQELPVYSLYWYTRTATEIGIDLVHPTRDWATLLSKRKLTEINYRKNGSLTLNETDLEDNWANGFIWQDDMPPFYLPMIRYNGTIAQQYVDTEKAVDFSKIDGQVNLTYNDFRPLISVLFTLQEMFALIGWKFKSPFFESEYGRTLFAYILQEKFAQDNGVNGKFRVSFIGTNAVFDTIQFNIDSGVEEYNGGQYLINTTPPTESYYLSPYTFPVRMNFKTNVIVSHSYGTKKIIEITIRVIYTDLSGVDIFDYKKVDFVVEAGETLECLVEWERAIVLPQYRVEVLARVFQGSNALVHSGSWFQGEMADNSYYFGDLLNPKVKEDYCLDYLKGAAHLCNGHLVTDSIKKEVTLYPPLSIEVQGEYIEGYYGIYTKEMQCSEYTVTFNNYENKTLKFGWKDSQHIRFADEPNYGVKSVRLNTDKTEESTDLNPYFQALFEDNILQTSPASPIVASIIVSKDDFSPLDTIEPFVVEALGNQYQSLRNNKAYSTGATILTRQFNLSSIVSEGVNTYDTVPYATQIPTTFSASGYPLKLRHLSSYGTFVNDFSQLYYEPVLKNTTTLSFLTRDIVLSEVVSQQILKSKIFTVVDGKPTVMYPTKVTDFQQGVTSIIEGVTGVVTSPLPCDGLLLKARYPVFTDILSGAYSFDCYLESFKINNEEQLTSQMLVGNPAFLGVTDFYTTLASIINLFVSCSYASSNIIIETNKCFWFQITLRKQNGSTLIDQWQRFDPIGTWTNISLNSGAATDTATWRLLAEPTNKTERYV